MRQADALRALLAREGPAMPVYVGMRNWAPYVDDVMREMAAQECGARSASSWRPIAARQAGIATSKTSATRASRPAARRRRSITPARGTPSAVHRRGRGARVAKRSAGWTRTRIAQRSSHFHRPQHSGRDGGAGRYVEQITESAAAGRARDWRQVVDARFSKPQRQSARTVARTRCRRRDLRELGAGRTAIVVPIGFICDHVEVLYDLDVEAAQIAREAG